MGEGLESQACVPTAGGRGVLGECRFPGRSSRGALAVDHCRGGLAGTHYGVCLRGPGRAAVAGTGRGRAARLREVPCAGPVRPYRDLGEGPEFCGGRHRRGFRAKDAGLAADGQCCHAVMADEHSPGPSDSRPLSRSPPRLLLFPHRRAAPSADVVVNLLIEQHQKETLSHWHGAFAGRAENLARFQVFKILLSVRRHHRLR